MDNSVSFSGKVCLKTTQFNNLPMGEKVIISQNFKNIADEFFKKDSKVKQEGKNIIFDVVDGKENLFIKYMNKIGLSVSKK